MVAPVIWAACGRSYGSDPLFDIVLRQNTPDVVQGSDSTLPAAQPTTSARFRFVRGLAMLACRDACGSVTYAFRVLPDGHMEGALLRRRCISARNFVLPTNANVTRCRRRNATSSTSATESIENSFYPKTSAATRTTTSCPSWPSSPRRACLSHTDKMGGPQQLTPWPPVAAMVAMNAGVPMLAPGDGNGTSCPTRISSVPPAIISTTPGTPRTSCSARIRNGLASVTTYRRHGNFTVHDIQTFAGPRGASPRITWWGVEDDKLYEYAARMC